MKRRLYKSGSTWALWRWTDFAQGAEYITRLHLVKTPWFAICLHWLNKPDPEPYLHDHPVSFLSIVLWGGYLESRWRNGELKGCRVSWFNWVTASFYDRHRIMYVYPGTLTLALMGPKTREWGFHTETGWKQWKAYYEERKAAK